MGGFSEPTGPGAGARGDFSADGVLLVRWASADFATFCRFLQVFDRLLGAFCGHRGLFASMSCACLYVNNFFSASLAWDLLTSNRKGRKARKGRTRGTTNGASPNHRKDAEGDSGNDSIADLGLRISDLKADGKAFNAENAEACPERAEQVEGTQRGGEESAKCRVPFESLRALSMVEGQSAKWTANGRGPEMPVAGNPGWFQRRVRRERRGRPRIG